MLASNIRAWRGSRGLTQGQLAERMTILGHEWSDNIVGFVERGDRAVLVDELLSLAMSLNVSIGDLLDPAGVDRRVTSTTKQLDYGQGALYPRTAAAWVRGTIILGLSPDGHGLSLSPADVPDLDAEVTAAAVRSTAGYATIPGRAGRR